MHSWKNKHTGKILRDPEYKNLSLAHRMQYDRIDDEKKYDNTDNGMALGAGLGMAADISDDMGDSPSMDSGPTDAGSSDFGGFEGGDAGGAGAGGDF